MRGVLISIDARDGITGAAVTVRIGAALNASTLGTGGYQWEPVLSRRPRLSMQLADDDLTGSLQVGQGEFTFSAAKLKNVANPLNIEWIGAPVRVYSGDGYDLSDMTLEFVGRATGGVPSADTGIVSVNMQVDRSIIDVPLIRDTYTGGGGINGDVELRGTTKPAGFGSPINVKPILIDAVNNVYQADAYGNLFYFAGVYEDLASFGASVGDYGSYAALVAAAIPEGRWGSCDVLGLFRLGAPASGTITCDPICNTGTPGAMMKRWIITHAQVDIGRVRTADFDALDTAVQAAAGEIPYVSYWTQDSGNVLDLVQRMCQSCNAVPLFLLDGTISVSRVIGGAEAVTLDRQGGDPPVTAWSTSDGPTPWWRMRMTAARSYYVNQGSEIDAEDTIVDRGDYDNAETYRLGQVVRAGDGARYLFINDVPSSGHAPPNAVYWELYEDAPDATTIRYTSGYTLQSKEPQEAGANVTEIRVASAITGQSPLATAPNVTVTYVNFLIGGGNLVKNSSFDGKTYTLAGGHGTMASGYLSYDNDALASTVWDLPAGRNGGVAQRITWVTNASQKGILLGNYGGVNNQGLSIANKTMVMSFYAKATGVAVGAGFGLAFNNAPTSIVAVTNPAASANWQRYVFRLAWGAVVDPNLFITTLATGGAGSVSFDDLQYEEGEVATAYARGLLAGDIGQPDLAADAVRLGQNIVDSAGLSLTDARAITLLGTAAAILSQGPGATATGDQVLNNSTDGGVLRIPAPVGGAASFNVGVSNGAIKIILPQGYTNTMIRFDVEVFNYGLNTTGTYTIAGYNYSGSPAWTAATASYVGPEASRNNVRFGHDAALNRNCIWIGDPGGGFAYPKIRVLNFVGGYSNFGESLWATGWSIVMDTAAATNVTAGPILPHPGEGVFGVNLLESSGGAAALIAAFKTILGTAGAISGQAPAATDPTIQPGADVTASKTPSYRGAPSFVLQADYNGTVTSIPAARQFSAYEGPTDKTTLSTWAIANVVPSGLAGYIAVDNAGSKGLVTLSAGIGSLTATLNATLPSGVVIPIPIEVSKDKAAQPVSGGAGHLTATLGVGITATTTTFVDLSDEQIVRTDGAGKVRVSMAIYASGGTTPLASRTGQAKVVYATSSGGSPTDTGAAATSTYVPSSDSGDFTFEEQQFTLPSPNTDYYFRVQGRRSSGTGSIPFTGTASIRQ